MAADMKRDQRRVYGERLNDGLSAATAGEGPPLVILPGLGQGADLAARVPRSVAWPTLALAAGFKRTVVQVNRPLCPPAGMTVADLAGWHATALRTRFGEPVDVMGISGGGVTGLQLALDHPGTVRRLVLCSAASRASDDGRRELLAMIELERQGRSTAWLGAALTARGPVRPLLAAWYARSRGRPRAPGEAALVEAAQDWDVTARLGELTIPVLAAGGTDDAIVPPDLVRATASGIPGGQLLLLEGRGHFTALYDPRLKPAIAAFLDGGQPA
jgi:pimeloyl-ACP methyl ester carboxylesterase